MMRWKQLAGRNAATWAVVAALLPLTAMHDVAQNRATATPAGIGANCLPPQQTIKPSTPGNAVVTLPTGDQVRLTTLPGGRDAVNPVLASGKTTGTGSAGLVRFSMGGDAYAVPYAAVPYLGSLLDPNLFDVSYLARARLDDAHSASLPVTVTYRTAARSARLALPGVRAAGTGTTLTKSRAPALGSLLAAGWRALHAGHRLAASDPLNGLARISLAPAPGSPAPPALPAPGIVQTGSRPHGAPPHYHTLTVNLVGRDGKPGVALGWVQNLDDPNYATWDQAGFGQDPATGTFLGAQGPIKLSVPDGTYSVQFAILSLDQGTYTGADAALVAKPQFTVGADTTVTLDARTAKPYSLTIGPGVSTRYRVDELVYTRSSSEAGSCIGSPYLLGLVNNSTATGGASNTLLAAPTAPVTDGVVGFEAITAVYPTDLTAPTAGSRYFMVFPSVGIPSSLSYRVGQRELTRVDEHIYDAPVITGHAPRLIAPTVFTSWGDMEDLVFEPAAGGLPPGSHTDYWFSGNSALTRWQGAAITGYGWILKTNAAREIRHGQQLSESWGEQPMLPSAIAAPEPPPLGGNPPFVAPFMTEQPAVPAARQRDLALLNIEVADATSADYADAAFPMASSLAFWRNGVQALQAPFAAPVGAVLPLLNAPATYRLDWQLAPWTTDRTADQVARTSTSWTFRSGPADRSVVPASEECGPDPARPCTFLPLLFPRYELPLDASSRAPAGTPLTFTFTVDHQEGEAPAAGVTATVAASFDDGKTWSSDVKATPLGGNQFKITITQPPLSATTGFGSLRVTAYDNAGNSVVQTLIRAYGLTG